MFARIGIDALAAPPGLASPNAFRCLFARRLAHPSGSLRLAISGFASCSVAPLGSFGSKLGLIAGELAKLDEEFEGITEGEELTRNESRAAWDAARLM